MTNRYAPVRTVGDLSRLLAALDPDTEVLFDQGEGGPWGNAKAGLVRRDGEPGPMALGITLDE